MVVTPNNGRLLISGTHAGRTDFGRDKVLDGAGTFAARIYP